MAYCAVLDVANGYVKVTATAIDACTSYVVLSGADFSSLNLAQSLVSVPTGSDFAILWAAGFSLPVTIGLIAWCVASVVKVSRGV